MIERRFRELWDRLQGGKPHFQNFLAEIHLDGIRGARNLRVRFDYPVSVIAGGNSSGKSTVLFAAACAYKVPGAGVRDFVPSTLFPDHRPRNGERADGKQEIVLEFDYVTPEGLRSMRWKRARGWNRSFLGRKGASQPRRNVYLRTLSNLSNPAEVRGVLSMSRRRGLTDETALTASQIAFAQQMLPFRYSEVVRLQSGTKGLLFAAQEGGAHYSELHMAAGERSILRLSQEIAQLRDALVLIDEVEAGLHPWMQQLLLLQLQQLALRNELQIIVTSHSPVVLDSVPANGRIFLERDDEGQVTVSPPYRDLVQDALYGRSRETMSLLCEDAAAEGILRGVFDVVLPRRRIRHESVQIGRDTGAGEFATHARAFRKFGQIDNFLFVLDGDKEPERADYENRIRSGAERDVPVLFLPGGVAPEVWVWRQLSDRRDVASSDLSITPADLLERMHRLDAIYDAASDRPAEIAKNKVRDLAQGLGRAVPEICRLVARSESLRPDSEIQPLVEGIENALIQWRAASGR